jgi:RNA recognition motif-containing protein
MNIYVGNLDFKVDEFDLKELFAEFGEVASAKVITDKFTGRSKGFGFVEMDNSNEAQKAIDDLNGSAFKNRNLVVNESKPKQESGNNNFRRRY